MTTPYNRGRGFEYTVREYLMQLGLRAFRVAGSKTPSDLVVLGYAHPLLVQCKLDGHLDYAEHQALWDWAVSCGAVPILAAKDMRRGHTRHPIFWRLTGPAVRHKSRPMVLWTPSAVWPQRDTSGLELLGHQATRPVTRSSRQHTTAHTPSKEE